MLLFCNYYKLAKIMIIKKSTKASKFYIIRIGIEIANEYGFKTI